MSQTPTLVTDPVCGMSIDPDTAADQTQHEGLTYHFCSAHCAAAFGQDPTRYTTTGA